MDMNLDWTRIVTHLISVTVAYLLALPVGWDREKEVRSAGLRMCQALFVITMNAKFDGAVDCYPAKQLRMQKMPGDLIAELGIT
jgi:uncharacterized membrane protein YhiD involved in acid resistance